MDLSKLISMVVTMTFLAASTGQLLQLLKALRIDLAKLIIESQTSELPKAMTLTSR